MSTAQMENSHRKRPGQGWRPLLLAGLFSVSPLGSSNPDTWAAYYQSAVYGEKVAQRR